MEPPCTYKLDSAASREWQRMSGCDASVPVPIENNGGEGSICNHFDEAQLNTELMTGFLFDPELVMSRLTVAALEDIGYEVDYSAAQPFDNINAICEQTVPDSEKRNRFLEMDSGLENAMQYGKDFLQRQSQSVQGADNARLANPKSKYIGNKSVSVFYIDESSQVRHVTVSDHL